MRYLKTYKIFEASHEEIMNVCYGSDTIKECDSLIDDIKDILLELGDIGLMITVGYTPMTLSYREKTPKIMVEISSYVGTWGAGRFLKGDTDCTSEVMEATERIKDYVKSKGYVTGDGKWESSGRMIYQMLIQK
jgi:hypothetical protein